MWDNEGRSFVEVTSEELILETFAALVADPCAGAVATFSGTTRNTFEGKEVNYLEYEAYVPMAQRMLQALCKTAHTRWGLTKVAVAHRVGRVDVGHTSVVIAASSPHRAPALAAVAWAIDELKATVPIWKKEVFADGSVWKENAEARARLVSE